MKSIIRKLFAYHDGTQPTPGKRQCLYVFLDEGGNLDFSANGTRYFTLTSVAKERSFEMHNLLTELKYDLLEQGVDLEYFHASEDNKFVRAQVFSIITANLKNLRIDSIVVEKKNVNPKLRVDARFYPQVIGRLLKLLAEDIGSSALAEVIVMTDQIPSAHRRQAVVKAIKVALSNALPRETAYRVFLHDSKSNLDLQIADYCNWAFFRKWERGELDYYLKIQKAVKNETSTILNESWRHG